MIIVILLVLQDVRADVQLNVLVLAVQNVLIVVIMGAQKGVLVIAAVRA